MKKSVLSIPMKAVGWMMFVIFYLWEVIRSNMYILWDVLTIEDKTRPSIIALDIPEEMTDNQVLLVSNLITMTPGSIALDLTADRKKLLIHILYTGDVEKTKRYLTTEYVHRIIHLS